MASVTSILIRAAGDPAPDAGPLVLLGHGVEPEPGLPAGTLVVSLGPTRCEARVVGSALRKSLAAGESLAAAGWELRTVGEGEATDPGVFAHADWTMPELRVRGREGAPAVTVHRFEAGATREIVVGRRPELATLVLDDEFVSGRHLLVYETQGRYFAKDLGSKSGSKVNGETISEPRELHHGDRIAVGATTIEFDWAAEEWLRSLRPAAQPAAPSPLLPGSRTPSRQRLEWLLGGAAIFSLIVLVAYLVWTGYTGAG